MESRIHDTARVHGVRQHQVRELLPFPIVPTDKAVARILRGVERDEAVIVLPHYARPLWTMVRWFPALASLAGAKAVSDFGKARNGTQPGANTVN